MRLPPGHVTWRRLSLLAGALLSSSIAVAAGPGPVVAVDQELDTTDIRSRAVEQAAAFRLPDGRPLFAREGEDTRERLPGGQVRARLSADQLNFATVRVAADGRLETSCAKASEHAQEHQEHQEASHAPLR